MPVKHGCAFCKFTAKKKGTINSHLNAYVPEIADAQDINPKCDKHHNVEVIRHGRYLDRAKWIPKNQPAKEEWKLERNALLKYVFTKLGERMVVSFDEKVCLGLS